MNFLKLFSAFLTLMLTFTALPFNHIVAKQKLDQPALLSNDTLKPIATIDHYIPDYIVIDTSKRLFVTFINHQQDSGPSLAILNQDHSITPYPGGEWNKWNTSIQLHHPQPNPANSFIGLAGMTLTKDGYLWLLDNGIDKIGQRPVLKGIKIVKIDLKSNQVVQTYPIPSSVILSKSILNTLAIRDHYAYFADKGHPALIVFDLKTGKARRVLENSSSLYSRRPIIVNHKLVRPANDQNSFYNINQLAITPDGKRIYYQAVSGPLYRIDTMYLNDPTYSEAELNEAMILWFDTPSSGGITCDDKGNLYFTDIATGSIYRFSTGRILNKLVTNTSLKWPGHPFISQDKTLYLPVMQYNNQSIQDYLNKPALNQSSSIYKIALPSLP